MIASSNDFLLPGMPHVDADTSFHDLGHVALHHPTQDLDGDGILDTSTGATDDGLVVVTDTDHDGFADHVSIVDGDGQYASWEFHQGADGHEHWEQIDHGDLES